MYMIVVYKSWCRSPLNVSLEAYPLFGAVQSPLQKRSHFDYGGLSHLGRSFNFLFCSELGTSYTEKSKFPFYIHYRKFAQKYPVFAQLNAPSFENGQNMPEVSRNFINLDESNRNGYGERVCRKNRVLERLDGKQWMGCSGCERI